MARSNFFSFIYPKKRFHVDRGGCFYSHAELQIVLEMVRKNFGPSLEFDVQKANFS